MTSKTPIDQGIPSLARIHARPSASARHFAAWLPTRRVILPYSLLSRGAMLLAAAGCVLAMPAMAKSSPGFDGPLSVHLRSDSITLRMAKAPQLYLAGTIDAAAVEQVR